jgi:hypothetical protein
MRTRENQKNTANNVSLQDTSLNDAVYHLQVLVLELQKERLAIAQERLVQQDFFKSVTASFAAAAGGMCISLNSKQIASILKIDARRVNELERTGVLKSVLPNKVAVPYNELFNYLLSYNNPGDAADAFGRLAEMTKSK